MNKNLKVGDTIKAGEFVMLTSGCYSSYGVMGVFRATADVVIPGVKATYRNEIEPDIHLLSTWLEEVPCAEVWRDY